MKQTALKRIIALILTLAMVTGMLPTFASAQSNIVHTIENEDVSYKLPYLPTTSNSYILLKNTTSKDVVLLVGLDGGYFGCDNKSVINYNSWYQTTSFNQYVSKFDRTTYTYWTATDGTASFSLSGYEIVYKSKDMYLVSPSWVTGHIFTTLPAGISWDDKIIISYSNSAYKLFKPMNNIGVWVDQNNTNNGFVYRDTLTSGNQYVTEYGYNASTRAWYKISDRVIGVEGYANEIFYVGSDVFLTDGTVKRPEQRSLYAKSPKSTGLQFEPLEDKEAKEFLRFIANVPDTAIWVSIDKELPQCYNLLTGRIEDQQEEIEAKVLFIAYFYLCLDAQLDQHQERIEWGKNYLIDWVKDETNANKIAIDEFNDALWESLINTISKEAKFAKIAAGYKLENLIMDYGELLIHSVGTILKVQRMDDIRYLRAYLELLEAEYRDDQIMIKGWKAECDNMLSNEVFGGHPQEMQKYAKYIFNIEHSISISFLAN